MKKIYAIIILLLFISTGSFAQTETQPNGTILQNIASNTFTAPVSVAANIASLNQGHFFRIVLPYCSTWSFNFINPNGNPVVMKMWLYNAENTANVIVNGATFDFTQGIPAPLAMNCGDTIYVQTQQSSGAAIGAYSLQVTEIPFNNGSVCNNSDAAALSIPIDTIVQSRLYGYDFYGNAAQDLFKVHAAQCGVLNIQVSGLPSTMPMLIQVFDSLQELVGSTQSNPGGPANLSVLLSGNLYYIRLSSQSTSYPYPYILVDAPFTVKLSYDISDVAECNNTFATAYSVPVNTTFDAKMWGVNNLIANGSAYNIPYDQDFYSVHPTQCGVLNIQISEIDLSLPMFVQVFDSLDELVGSSQTNPGTTTNSLSVLLTDNLYYIRLSSQSTSYPYPYILVDSAFKVTLSYDISDVAECNNTFATAYSVPVNTTFDAKMWGVNNLIANGSAYNIPYDQDFYSVHPTQCGVLNIQISELDLSLPMFVQVFDSLDELVGSSQTNPGTTTNSLSVLLTDNLYYIRLSSQSTSYPYPYILVDSAFKVALSYDVSDVAECNNTFATAYSVPVNTTFDAKMWGVNNLIANGSAYNIPYDQDFYSVHPTQCGVLNIQISELDLSLPMLVQVFDSLEHVIASTQSNPGVTANLNVLLSDSLYYIRLSSQSTSYPYPYILVDSAFKVSITYSPLADITSTTDSICTGTSINFTASANNNVHNWTWNFGPNANPDTSTSQNPTNIDFNASGQNIVTLSVNGCSIDTAIINVYPITPTPTISNAGLTLKSSANSGNQWYLNNSPISNATDSTYLAIQNGTYKVCVSSPLSSCGTECSDPLVITTVGIEELNSTTHFYLFPNPATDNLTITLSDKVANGSVIEILDPLGKKVSEMKLIDETTATIDLSNVASGIYFVKVQNEKGAAVQKFIKE